MLTRTLMGLVAVVLLLVLPGAVGAQYMYLDANGNGVHDLGDHLNANGAATTVDIYLWTDMNRNGTTAVCDVGSEPLTINSFVVNLRAVGGTVTYANFVNQQTATMPIALVGELNSGVQYSIGFGGPTFLPPGHYRLGTLTITGATGLPRIDIVDGYQSSPDFTGFGTSCSGLAYTNQYWLDGPNSANVTGSTGDFTDWDGLAAALNLSNRFFDCGRLIQGIECVLFQSDNFGTYLLQNRGTFQVGDRVLVLGQLLPTCLTPCLQNAGCIRSNFIGQCPPATGVPIVAAPVAVFGAEGELMTVDVFAADPDGAITSLTADLSGLPLGHDAVFAASPLNIGGRLVWKPGYMDAGTYAVTFTASNSESGSATTSITVRNVNRAPIADAGGPYNGAPGAAISFNGSHSSDPDGDALTYAWAFGDGDTGSGATPLHTYTSTAGSPYTVTLTVSDGALTGTATTTAIIAGHDVESDGRDQGYARLVGSLAAVRGPFNDVDFARYVQVVLARGNTGVHHLPRRLREGTGTIDNHGDVPEMLGNGTRPAQRERHVPASPTP